MENRTGKQCRERYFNHLQPNIKKGNWSDEEDNIIIQLIFHLKIIRLSAYTLHT